MSGRAPISSVITRLRDTSRGGAMLALVAMALQLVATFGHVHLADVSPFSSFKSVAHAKAAPAPALAKIALPGADDLASTPPASDSDALCALCLVGHLVASAAFVAPPVLVLPVAYLLLGPPPAVAVFESPDVATSFWSRGPPQS